MEGAGTGEARPPEGPSPHPIPADRLDIPTVHVDEDRIQAPAPRRDLSPAEALDLVRRSMPRPPHDEPGDTP